MTATMTAERAFAEVRAKAEQIKNDETATIGTVSKGDVIRQGDLYLVSLGSSMPSKGKPVQERQLAPGNSQGSRHVLTGECEVYACDYHAVAKEISKALHPINIDTHTVLIGPVVKTLSGCELTHPEHGDRVLPDGEVFAVVYQRAYAEEVRRQVD